MMSDARVHQRIRVTLDCLCVLAGLILWSAAAPTADPPNVIFNQLLERGATIDRTSIRLSGPTFPDGLNAQAQQRCFVEITDDNHPFEALVRKAVVAPFVLRIKDEPDAGPTRPRRVDIWFVAYGDFERLSEEDFLTKEVDAIAGSENGSSSSQSGVLTDEDLRERGIAPDPNQRYLTANFTLFDRVSVSGTMQAMLTRSADSVVLAAISDPRFTKDPKFPNAWRPIRRDESGQLSTLSAQPYGGAAWYCKATRLVKPAGAVLIEYHLIFDEPVAWFNGANLLRSKLPLLVQDGVRKFRRRFAQQASRSAN